MSSEAWIIVEASLWITGIVLVGKAICALVDMWAAWSIGRICDKCDVSPENRRELMQRCRDRNVGR